MQPPDSKQREYKEKAIEGKENPKHCPIVMGKVHATMQGKKRTAWIGF